MIDLSQLTQEDIGRKAVYRDSFTKAPEEGILSSWNDKYVFIRFKGPNGEACDPSDVELLGGQ